MSVTASVRGTITLTDNLTGSTSLSKVLNNAFIGTLSSFAQTITLSTSPYTVALPNGLCQFAYIRNLSTLNSNTISVSWTPNGGSSVIVVTLDPGALIILCEATTSNGVSAMSLTANQSGTPVEFIVAG